MTDADTQTAAASPVATLVAGTGLVPDPRVVDGASLAGVPGPLLTGDLVAADGATVGAVAVLDDPDGDPDGLLQSLGQAATQEAGSGTTLQPAGPVGDGAALAERFPGPITVAAFGDGQQVKALIATPVERRRPEAAGVGVAVAGGGDRGPIDKLVNVSLDVSVELGRTNVTLAEVLDYDVGSVVELDRAAGAPVDIRVNGTLLAHGEVVLIDDEYAVRITAILDPNGAV
ncbi:MAG: flagellar motor switch protein FliN [Actinomycetota bacterium]